MKILNKCQLLVPFLAITATVSTKSSFCSEYKISFCDKSIMGVENAATQKILSDSQIICFNNVLFRMIPKLRDTYFIYRVLSSLPHERGNDSNNIGCGCCLTRHNVVAWDTNKFDTYWCDPMGELYTDIIFTEVIIPLELECKYGKITLLEDLNTGDGLAFIFTIDNQQQLAEKDFNEIKQILEFYDVNIVVLISTAGKLDPKPLIDNDGYGFTSNNMWITIGTLATQDNPTKITCTDVSDLQRHPYPAIMTIHINANTI